MAALRLSTGLHVIALAPSEFPIPSFFAKSLCAHIVIPSHLIIAGAALSAPRYHASTSLTEPAERLLRPVSVAAGVQGSSDIWRAETSNLQSVSSQPAVHQHISRRTATLHNLLDAASGRTLACAGSLSCAYPSRHDARILDVLFCAGSSASSLECTTHGARALGRDRQCTEQQHMKTADDRTGAATRPLANLSCAVHDCRSTCSEDQDGNRGTPLAVF